MGEKAAGLVEHLQGHAAAHGHEIAIEIEGEPPVTWQALDDRADGVAEELARLDHHAGESVLLAVGERTVVPELVHGVLRRGGVVVNVDPTTPAAEVQRLASRSRASIAVVDPALAEGLGTARRSSFGRGLVALVLERNGVIPTPDLATVIFTSGSTGRPKGVLLTHSSLLQAARRMAQVRQHTSADRHLCFLSFAHFAEQFMSVWLHALVGYRVLVSRQRSLAEAVKVGRPTFLMGVPAEWHSLQRAMASLASTSPADIRHQLGIANVRLALTTGAPLAPDVHQAFRDVGLSIHEMYGMTETTGAATFNAPGVARVGSVGQALPGSRIEVDEAGEVWILGPQFQSPGYLDDPADQANTFQEERVRTGDLGMLDGNGYLFLTGRRKEMIILSTGKKVHPAPLEAKLQALAGVRHAALFGDGKPFLVAVIDVEPGMEKELAAALERLNAQLPRHERIRRFIEASPFSVAGGELTASLKVRREGVLRRHAAALEQLYEAQRLG
jgi:long-chain acyl-CoA synthetase